jgi:HEAT repeat protein
VSDLVDAPVLYGMRRPLVLLPEGWLESLDGDDVSALLAHEAAHIKRRDFMANLLQRLMEIPVFFHPGAWLASGRIALAREELADAWALGRAVDAGGYARSLAAAAERAQARPSVASIGVAEGRSTLLRRVEAIMRGGRLRRMSRPVAIAVTALVVSVSAVLAMAQLQSGERQAASPELDWGAPLGQLVSHDPMQRQEAVGLIWEAGARSASSIPELVEMLADETPIPAAIIHDEEFEATTNGRIAARALARLGETALPHMLDALSDDRAMIRRGAAMTLGLMADELGTRPLQEAAADRLAATLGDGDQQVAQAAAVALGLTTDERALEPLLAMLTHLDPDVRAEAARGLTYQGSQGARDALFAALTDRDPQVRKTAAFAFGYESDARDARRLARALTAPDPVLRAGAAEAFYHTNSSRAIRVGHKPLVETLKDHEPSVRLAALKGLNAVDRLGESLDLAPLLPLLSDRDPRVRSEAVRALTLTGRPEAIQHLAAALSDSEAAVRGAAARGFSLVNALGLIGGGGAVDTLVAALDDPAAEVRLHAADALGNIGDERALDALESLLEDQDVWLKSAAALALCIPGRGARGPELRSTAGGSQHAAGNRRERIR